MKTRTSIPFEALSGSAGEVTARSDASFYILCADFTLPKCADFTLPKIDGSNLPITTVHGVHAGLGDSCGGVREEAT